MEPALAQKILEEFIAFLRGQREAMIEEWLSSVSRNGQMQTSERLSVEELKQHLPGLLDDLAEVLRSPMDRGVRAVADEHARQHGHRRFGQCFHLDELVREITALRSAIVGHVVEFEERTADFRSLVKRVALQRLHGFFDNLIADAVEQFTQEQEGKLRSDLVVEKENTAHQRRERDDARAESKQAKLEANDLRDTDANRLHLLRDSVASAHLTVIRLKNEAAPGPGGKWISMLGRNIAHMDTILTDLLEYPSLLDPSESASWEAVSLADLADEMTAVYFPIASAKGLQFEVECEPGLDNVISDRTKLVQLVSNLLSNAVKETTSGAVRLLLAGVDDDYWLLVLEDSGGPGISAEEHENIFTEFHHARHTAELSGTGPGLAMVKSVTELLGGEVHVQSVPGEGSRFEIILPRARGAAEPAVLVALGS